MRKNKDPGKSRGTPVVIENEGGIDIVKSDEGKEIRCTKDYGLGADILFCMSNKMSYPARNIIPQVFYQNPLPERFLGHIPEKTCGII